MDKNRVLNQSHSLFDARGTKALVLWYNKCKAKVAAKRDRV